MSILHYVKVSDIDYDFCFLEVSQNEDSSPFMDVRISDDRKLSFYIYGEQAGVKLSPEEWIEVHEKALSFYKSEIENDDASGGWGS